MESQSLTSLIKEGIEMGKIMGMSPLESFIFYRTFFEGREDASKLYDLLISQTFFCSMVQDFNVYATVCSPSLFQRMYQSVFEILLGKIAYYLKVCTSADDVTRDNFADLVQCENAAQLKPEIYDLLVKLQNQVEGFQNLEPSLEQVFSIKETLKRIVDLAGTYDAQASSN
jgi:hypothetical protein